MAKVKDPLKSEELDEFGNPIVAAPAVPVPEFRKTLPGLAPETSPIGVGQSTIAPIAIAEPTPAAAPTPADALIAKTEGAATANVARPAPLFDANVPSQFQLGQIPAAAAPVTGAATPTQPTSWNELKAMRATPVMTGRLVDSMEKQYPGWANLTPTERNATLRNQIDLERSAGVRRPLPPAPNVSMGKGFGIGGAFEYGQGEKPMEIGSEKYNQAVYDIANKDKSIAGLDPNKPWSAQDEKNVAKAYADARAQLSKTAYLLDPKTGNLTMPGGGTGKMPGYGSKDAAPPPEFIQQAGSQIRNPAYADWWESQNEAINRAEQKPQKDKELSAFEQKQRAQIAKQEKAVGIERGQNGELWSDAMAKKQLEDVPFARANPSKESMGIYKGQDRVAKGELPAWFNEEIARGGALNSSSRPSGDVDFRMKQLRAQQRTERTRAGNRGYTRPPMQTEAQRRETAEGEKAAAGSQIEELNKTFDTLEQQGGLSAQQREGVMQAIQNNPSLAETFLNIYGRKATARPK